MKSSNGIDYFFDGFRLIRTKGIKRFVFIPLAVNLILFSTALYFLIGEIGVWVNSLVDMVPDFLGFLKDGLAYVLTPLFYIAILLGFALIFGTMANWIAAPFNGLLSEKIEKHLTGQDLGPSGLLDVFKDIPRTLGRELAKLLYYIPRAIGFLLLFFLLPVIGQVLWFLFSAWMMAVQYCDYPFDNHKVPFKVMRRRLTLSRSNSFGFGIMVSVFSMIPIVNFIVMPAAICGATAMWVDDLRHGITD